MPRTARFGKTRTNEPRASPLPPPPPVTSTPVAPSLFGSLAHGAASGTGWALGTGLFRTLFGDRTSSAVPVPPTRHDATPQTDPTVPTDPCVTLRATYQRCVTTHATDLGHCDPVWTALDAMCPTLDPRIV